MSSLSCQFNIESIKETKELPPHKYGIKYLKKLKSKKMFKNGNKIE